MSEKQHSIVEWIVPLAFIAAAGWAIWHIPAYMLTIAPPSDESLFGQVRSIHERNDVTPDAAGLIGFIDVWDLLAIVMLPVLAIFGTMTVRRAGMEFPSWRAADRLSVFLGRVTMMLIALLTSVMLYEVFLRYVIERPTLWANELSLWLAGFVFLLAGLYAMQQRSHIRIFLLYDVVPRWMQKMFDVISTALILLFAFFLVFGSYNQVFINKLYRWETFGTAFDPPLPATIQPMILIAVTLVGLQAVVNLISDWNAEPESHVGPDDIDEEEIEALKRTLGAD